LGERLHGGAFLGPAAAGRGAVERQPSVAALVVGEAADQAGLDRAAPAGEALGCAVAGGKLAWGMGFLRSGDARKCAAVSCASSGQTRQRGRGAAVAGWMSPRHRLAERRQENNPRPLLCQVGLAAVGRRWVMDLVQMRVSSAPWARPGSRLAITS
jgi:hypothetical protein